MPVKAEKTGPLWRARDPSSHQNQVPSGTTRRVTVACKFATQHAFLAHRSKTNSHDGEWNDQHPPPGAQQQGRPHEHQQGAGIHGMANDAVGPVTNHALLAIALHAYLRGRESIETKRLPDDNHTQRDQQRSDGLHPKRNDRPPEATGVKGARHQPCDEDERGGGHEGAVPWSLIRLHRRRKTVAGGPGSWRARPEARCGTRYRDLAQEHPALRPTPVAGCEETMPPSPPASSSSGRTILVIIGLFSDAFSAIEHLALAPVRQTHNSLLPFARALARSPIAISREPRRPSAAKRETLASARGCGVMDRTQGTSPMLDNPD